MLRFDKQPSFELGVIAFEVCAGCHPIEDYLTAERHMRGYTAADLAEVPDVYPEEFIELLRSLVAFEPGELVSAQVGLFTGGLHINALISCVYLPAHRPTIADAATRLSTLRQSLFGSDVIIARQRDALRRAHEQMVCGAGRHVTIISVNASALLKRQCRCCSVTGCRAGRECSVVGGAG